MSIDFEMPILVVDDYKTMVRIIGNLLKQLGFYNIDEATDGNTALLKLQKKKYDLVISDWNMQPVSGLDLLRNMRETDSLKKTPFIMVTAESKTENVVTAKEARVDNYIVKPFTASTLKSKMSSIFGNF